MPHPQPPAARTPFVRQPSIKRIHLLLLLLLLLLATSSVERAAACPAEVCVCKWKGGKQTVECGGQQLPSIPEGMDPGTQVLNFSGNSLQVLQSERFLRMDLLNLQKIYLSRNQLIRIHEKAFRGLTNLVELDLSDNSLQHVPSETFQDYSSLMRLSLSGNPIRELKTSAFRYLAFLTTLELSNCQIERIENEAFVGMDNLEWLRLDGNRIGHIQGNHILPKSLHGISLQSNRWTCDCRLLDMHAWLVNYNTPQIEEPRCMEPPRLKGQLIKALKKDELACMPEVSPKSSYTEISEGRNISIVCVVRGIPEPKVLWLFNGQVMSNDSLMDNLHMFYYIDESGDAAERRSEIFIYNVGAEDNGTFSCLGQNIAGTTFSNYTLRVIIKEPPVVKEVSFPRDYMNYIIASSTGAAVIFVVLLCTIVVKCKQRKPSKRKKCAGNGSAAVTSVAGPRPGAGDGNANDSGGLMKCSSIISDNDSVTTASGLTPRKLCKENGVIISGQMKQNLLLYAPSHFQQALDSCANGGGAMSGATGGTGTGTATPPPLPPLMVGPAMGGSISYCSPPSSVRNYQQEKNPDLVNDAESVKHKLKAASLDASGGGDYDAASECSGPCSIQGGMSTPVAYENCYQLAPPFGSQLLRPTVSANVTAASRFAAMTTLPRGMQLKTVLSSLSPAPQHHVDVHLNPVCFLGQDGFAYDYSNAHLQQPAPTHHHLQLQALSPSPQPQQPQQQDQQQQQQQQNFYRTLPHNRVQKQQQFAASLANPGMRYSLEAEFLQRSGTPTYDKYLPNVRFTAEGYPQSQSQPQPQHLVQYPSPPEGYKTGGEAASFQQWPPCLPGYHAQPVRYPPTIVGVLSSQQPPGQAPQPLTSSTASQSPSPSQSQSGAGSPLSPGAGGEAKKRCGDAATIPECDESDASPTPSDASVIAAPSSEGAAGLSDDDSSKLRHLNGPLADSPDEGYVGDSHEGSDI